MTTPLVIDRTTSTPKFVVDRWVVAEMSDLATIIGIISMGQAAHAREIISALRPLEPAFTHSALVDSAIRTLTITRGMPSERKAARWRRDGLLFEAISWIAARQEFPDSLLRDPHLSSTTQGLDGLMIGWNASSSSVDLVTVFEDKCSKNPRTMFRDDVLPNFEDVHRNGRAPDLVATASLLLQIHGLAGSQANVAAAAVLDRKFRAYRASLAVTSQRDSEEARISLFKGYDRLKGIRAARRIGATLVTSSDLRDWFDLLAAEVIAYLSSTRAAPSV